MPFTDDPLETCTMWLDRLNTRIAADAGIALAERFIAVAPGPAAVGRHANPADRREAIFGLLAGVDRDVRPLQLGFFRRAKLGNTFKWRLLEHGVEPALADELTRLVLHRLVPGDPPPTPQAPPDPTPESQPESGSVRALLDRADACVALGAHAEVIE